MSNINFTIDSKDKNKLSTRARNFHYAFGLVLILSSSLGIYRFSRTNADAVSCYSFILIFLTGTFWIIRGFIGRDFMFIRKYFSITCESLSLKKPYRKEIQLSQNSIDQISVKPLGIALKTMNETFTFDLTWLSNTDLQTLRKNITEFAELNGIELK